MVNALQINPFSYVLSRGDFITAGREELLSELARVITQKPPDDRDLHGLMQLGKTKLLHYLVGPEFIKQFAKDFFEPFDKHPERLFFVIVSGWNESTHPFIVIYREYRRQFMLFRKEHPDLQDRDEQQSGLPQLQLDEETELDADKAIGLVELHLWAMYDRGYQPVILFDDFATEWAFAKLDLEESTKVGRWKDHCSLIFVTERLLEEVNPRAKGSPLFKRLTQSIIKPMLPAQAARFICAAIDTCHDTLPEGARITIPDQDIAMVAELAGGFPYFLLLGGRELWELRRELGLLDRPDVPLPDAVHTDLRSRLAENYARIFDLYYRELSEKRREILLDLAETGSFSAKDMSKSTTIAHNLSWLTKYGLAPMRPNGDRVLFSSLFRDFLLSVKGETLKLPRQQSDLYDAFRNRPREPLSYVELGQVVWDWPAGRRAEDLDEVEKRKIHLAVHKLKVELQRAGSEDRIVNVRNRGYRYEPAS